MSEKDSFELRFGGGVNSRASEEDINPAECYEGINFELSPLNREFKNRKPFDLIGTVPNGAEIRGLITLKKTDGTVTALVQAGNTVYEWDGLSNFTSRGTVDAAAQLRGRKSHAWNLDDKVIITDLNLQQPVMEWDGTTLQNVTFSDETLSTTWTGEFRARYCDVYDERAIFMNIYDNGNAFPHMIIGSMRTNYSVISVAQRPSSALSDLDPFFLLQPDLHYINGSARAFGTLAISSKDGDFYKLTGGSAKDFAMDPLYPGSGATGDESVVFVGNDIFYGRSGRIESLISTDKLGDVDTDDLSLKINDDIQTFEDWTIVYNQRTQKVYCFPNQSQIWVYHKAFRNSEVSPWVKYTTQHSMAFNPTAVMNMYDPADGLEYVFFGDSNGNFYRMEGSGANGDGGTNTIVSERLAGLIMVPEDGDMFDIDAYIEYRKNDAETLTLSFEFMGYEIFEDQLEVPLDAATGKKYWGGANYWNDGQGWGYVGGKLTRTKAGISGKGSGFQIRTKVESTNDFQISKVGVSFRVEK